MLVLETQGNSSISQVNNKREKDGESTRQNTKSYSSVWQSKAI